VKGQRAVNINEVDLAELGNLEPPDLLRFAFRNFPDRAAIGTSLQKSGTVMIDMAAKLGLPIRVFYIDTLLDYQETYDLLERLQQRYGISIERYQPLDEDIQRMRAWFGQWEHFRDRRYCCDVRKSRPLKRAQETLDVWIAGLRADQSEHRRATTPKAELVRGKGARDILKLNPLLEWTDEDVDRYIAENDVPYNALYDYVSPYGERYTVISCERCHIPVLPGVDKRGGKFPWETPGGKKECGLHQEGSGI